MLVISTYRRPELLCRALSSIAAQFVLPDQVIVAAWTGGVAAIAVLDECRRAAPPLARRLEVIGEPNDSMIAKDNRAIGAATGDVVTFMNDDAEAPVEWLSRLLCWYSHPSVGAVGGRDIVSPVAFCDARATVGRLTWFGCVHSKSSPRCGPSP